MTDNQECNRSWWSLRIVDRCPCRRFNILLTVTNNKNVFQGGLGIDSSKIVPNLNVNRYFLTKSSRESHAIELNLFLWCEARRCHWKCGYTKLEAATINHLHAPVTTFMFGCSGTKIYDPEVRDEGSDQLRDNDQAPWYSVVYYLGFKHMHHGWKAKVSPLDHCCLLN